MDLPYLVAVDLDGTLLGDDKRVSARTQAAIAAVSDAGHHVVAVTGRGHESAAPLLAHIPAIEYIVGSNGAYAYRVATGSLDWSQPIRTAEADRWIALIRARLPGACFGWESEAGTVYEEEFLALRVDPLADDPDVAGTQSPGGDLHKLFVRSPSVTGRELQGFVTDLLIGAAEVSSSGIPFVEVTAAGVDKGSGLVRIARALDVPLDRTIVFGDNLNDVPMFRMAGSAVAMGNAVAEIRALADRVTSPNTADGVAEMLETLLVHGMR